MSAELKTEFHHYLAHQAEFVKKYQNKYIVIKGTEVLGAYSDEETAVKTSRKHHELGTFLVQLVQPGTSGYTRVFRSRVLVR